jgi:hypothetical protein
MPCAVCVGTPAAMLSAMLSRKDASANGAQRPGPTAIDHMDPERGEAKGAATWPTSSETHKAGKAGTEARLTRAADKTAAAAATCGARRTQRGGLK